MDIEDLVYNAGRKGRTADGKSKASVRKEAVVNATVASNLKTILEGQDHSLLTRSQDPALVKVGKALDLRSKNPEVTRSAMASVNLMEDYSGVSPSDIASFRSANPLLEDFAVEVLESVAFDEETRASSLKSRRKGKKSKGTNAAEAKKVVTGPRIDSDGNLISTGVAAATSAGAGTGTTTTAATTTSNNPTYLGRRKSFDELNYLYRAQIVKSQQKRPETKQQRLKAELTRKRLARENNQGKSQQQAESADDGAGTAAPKIKSRKDMTTIEKTAEERRKWRLVETAQDKKRREKLLHDSLIRMFELQVRMEEEEKAKRRVLKGGGKAGKRSNFFSMFRVSSSEDSRQTSQSSTAPAETSPASVEAGGKGQTTAGAGKKPEKRASLFDSLPRLF